MNPKEIVLQWVAAFNNEDVIGLSSLYAENAVNHQVNQNPIQGKDKIQKMFEQEFSQTDMHCIVENIFEDGNWAILEWKDPLGLRGCGFFQTQDDKIVFQRGYWDRLCFLRMHNLPIPDIIDGKN